MDELKHLCHRNHEWMNAPFRVDGYAVATDGCMLLAILGALETLEGLALPDPPDEKATKLVHRSVSEAPSSNAIATDVNELRHWTGEAKAACDLCKGTGSVLDCPDCDGYGVVENDCPYCGNDAELTCGRCDGSGRTADGKPRTCGVCHGSGESFGHDGLDASVGIVAGVIVDKRRLSALLRTVDGPCSAWSNDMELHVRGDGWHAVLMGARGGVGTPDQFPGNVRVT